MQNLFLDVVEDFVGNGLSEKCPDMILLDSNFLCKSSLVLDLATLKETYKIKIRLVAHISKIKGLG